MPVKTARVPMIKRALLSAVLGAMKAVPLNPLLQTPKIHLWKTGPATLTPDTAIADFTEATFAGYAAVTLPAYSAVINLPSGVGEGLSNNASFIGGAIVAPGENILGYWIDDGGANLYYFERFDAPVPFVNPGDWLDVVDIVGLPFVTQLTP